MVFKGQEPSQDQVEEAYFFVVEIISSAKKGFIMNSSIIPSFMPVHPGHYHIHKYK